jgi:hypothetical protein
MCELEAQDRLILWELQERGQPMDAILVASRTRLQVRDVLGSLSTLENHGLVFRAAPDPVHERYALT